MKKVSVIVPVYNVEKFLPQCLDSIIHQTYQNLEIICVNDCSPDNSATILQKYAQKDKRIRIINREKNGGLSAARNTGLDIATGEYVYFIDSDDWIDADYIETMVKAIEKSNTDIVVNTNIQNVENGNTSFFVWPGYSKILPDGEFLSAQDAVNYSQVMICVHLYRKSFLDKYHLSFPEGYIHEDEYFQHISKIRCEKVFCFYGAAYYYRQHPQSIMATRKSKVISCAKIINLLLDFYKKNTFLKHNNIHLPIFGALSDINTEEEFKAAKRVANRIVEGKFCFYLSDFNVFLLKTLIASGSLSEFKQKIGKDIKIAYVRQGVMLKPKVSVIIPIYKVEAYIRKCLDSVCNQTLREIEIICVNDCSPDGSLEILKEYKLYDNRIKIIDLKENKGAGYARNRGIDSAKGKYIGFVDPDDWIDLDFYEKLYEQAEENDADAVKGKIKLIFDGIENMPQDIVKVAKSEYAMMQKLHKKIKADKMYFRCMFTTAIYKRDMINSHNIRFIENCVCGEDLIVPIKTAVLANKILVVDDVTYFYLRRYNSATTSKFTTKRVQSLLLFQNTVLDFLNSENVAKKHYRYIVRTYINENDYFNILNFYKNNQLDFMQELIKVYCKIKYKAHKYHAFYKILNNYEQSGDLDEFLNELQKLSRILIMQKIREDIRLGKRVK